VVQTTARRTFTLVKALLVIVIFLVAVYYFTVTFTTQDLTWFASDFNQVPYLVVVYNAGQKTEYRAGTPGYEQLAGAVQQSLASGVVRQSGIGLSEESLADAYNKYISVEAFFAQPVKLHANYYTGYPEHMLFLITGRHSELNLVFLGGKNGYNVSAPALKTIQPLRDALNALGFQ
jgi:hypothetical protein